MRVIDIFEKRSNATEQSHNRTNKETTWSWKICKKVGFRKSETLGYGDFTGKRKDAVKAAKAQAKELGGSICDFADQTF